MANYTTNKFAPRWVHVRITDEDLWSHFETMANAHQGGRSAFLRWLIDQEWVRSSLSTKTTLGKGNKLDTQANIPERSL